MGRIAGIRVGVNWSVLVIFGLIAYGLAARRFPEVYPGYSDAAYVVAGLITAVVFFGSLLAHELAHAVVARRNGLTVEGITLWLFGGVAKLQGEAGKPGADLRIAGVGPLVSLILGAFFFGVTVLFGAVGVGGLPLASVGWLALINVALAIFNVIPAAPLDGGRLLRAVVWWFTGDRTRATVRASQAGQVFGWFVIAFGLVTLFTQGSFGGLWLALIGWFLVSAASAEGQQAAVRARLGRVPVRDVMSTEPVTAPQSMNVATFLDGHLVRNRHSAYPVVDDAGETVGLVTFDRIRRVDVGDRPATLVGEISSPLTEVAQASPAEPVSDVLARLSGDPYGRALVFAGGQLVGIVSPKDINRTLERMSLTGWSAGTGRRKG